MSAKPKTPAAGEHRDKCRQPGRGHFLRFGAAVCLPEGVCASEAFQWEINPIYAPRLTDGSSGVSRCLLLRHQPTYGVYGSALAVPAWLLAFPRPPLIRALTMRYAGEMQMRQSSIGETQ